MKQLLIVIVCFLSFSISSLAQTSETFDIATFQPPNGWKKQNKGRVIIFSTFNEQKGTYAMITLYGSGESSGNAKTDFEADWQQFVVGQFRIKSKPQTEPAKNAEGWEIITGGAAFENEQGTAVVALNTFSGFGKTFSLAAIFNSQDSVPAIEAFISSIKLRKPETNLQPAQATTNSTASILGTWGMGASGSVRYDDYKNPNSVNGYGYSNAQYTFNSNGTYSFVSKTFRMTFDKILLVKESGTFQISGNNITINPQKSVIEAWSKRDGIDKWGRLLTTQNRTLERVTYQFTRHYFSGIQLWNLVLQADQATQRDGPFSGNTTFSNAWYYAPISSNNPVIELPR
jgi:hypothetical protein